MDMTSIDKNYDRRCCDINIVFCNTQFQDNSSEHITGYDMLLY